VRKGTPSPTLSEKNMNEKWKTRSQIVFVSFHLMLISLGAASTHVKRGDNNLVNFLENYRVLTGAGEGYGFFSPNLPNQLIADAWYTDSSGHGVIAHFGLPGREVDLRIGTLMYAFRKLETYDLMARNFAAYVLGHHPGTKTVKITLSEYVVPSMSEFIRGERPHIQEFYSGEFIRNDE